MDSTTFAGLQNSIFAKIGSMAASEFGEFRAIQTLEIVASEIPTAHDRFPICLTQSNRILYCPFDFIYMKHFVRRQSRNSFLGRPFA
jgi:hypothetical protein